MKKRRNFEGLPKNLLPLPFPRYGLRVRLQINLNRDLPFFEYFNAHLADYRIKIGNFYTRFIEPTCTYYEMPGLYKTTEILKIRI